MKRLILLSTLMFSAALGFAQLPLYVPTNGLVAAYLFNGNANDLSGTGNNGVVSGAQLTTDRFGMANKAYNFTGPDMITIARNPSIEPSNAISISCWAYLNQITQFAGVVVKRWAVNTDPWTSYSVQFDGNNNWSGHIGRGIAGSIRVASATSRAVVEKWVHLVVVYDGSAVRFYQDGQLAGTIAQSGSIAYSNEPLRIGYTISGNPPFALRGRADDVFIYNRALTAEEVAALYKPICSHKLTEQPKDYAANSGENIMFKVNALEPGATFLWQMNMGTGWINLSNAGQFSGVDTKTLEVKNISKANEGTKFRCISSGFECNDTSAEATIKMWAVSVKEKLASSIKIHPNPFQDDFSIALSENTGILSYEISDIFGKILSSGQIEGSGENVISLENAKPGVLIIRLFNEEFGSIYSSRIIKL